MAADRRPNKNSATEDELGLIHSLTTRLHAARLKTMLEQINSGVDAEAVIGDGKALAAAGKWAADQNSITAAQPEMDEETELAQALAKIKQEQGGAADKANGSSVSFDDGHEYH